MTSPTAMSEANGHPRDREPIVVGHAGEQMGIAAALRQAFEQAATEPSDCDFDELLRRLN